MRTLSTVMSELMFAARRLAADRWAAGAAILAVAIGAGLNTAVFAAAYGILLRPLPFADPARLVVMDVERRVSGMQLGVRLDEFDEWRRQLRGFDSVAAYAGTNLVVRGAGDSRLVQAALVSDSFFDVLGTRALRGRLFTAAPAGAVSSPEVVVSERFARLVFGKIDAAVGRGLTLNQHAVTIVGVLPSAVGFPADSTDLWATTTTVEGVRYLDTRDARSYRGIGRLRDGISLVQARDELQRIRDAWAEARRPKEPTGPPPSRAQQEDVSVATLTPIGESLVRDVRPIVATFAAGVALVLLIACANVATILVGRAVARQREFAIQRALGAGAFRLVTSMLAESLVIAFSGSALGLFIAWITVRVLRTAGADLIARVDNVAIDWPVFAFATLLSFVVGLVAAIVPARRGLGASVARLRVTSASPGRPARRARAVLTVAQVALAVVILAGGALLVRTVFSLLAADIGVNARDAVSMRLLVTDAPGFAAASREPLVRDLLDRVRALPGVRSAGLGTNLPPARSQITMTIRVVDGTRDASMNLSLASVTPGYLDALGARVLRGRTFDERDLANPRGVVVLSATAARHMFNSIDVAGKTLSMTMPGSPRGGPRPIAIGVIDDIKYTGLDRPAGAAIYVPWQALPAGEVYLAVRMAGTQTGAAIAAGDLTAAGATVRRTLREVDATLPVIDVRPLDEAIANAVADRRLRALLGGSIALLAFAVALIGLAGGLLHAVTERRRELAIRAALGATPRRAVRMVLGEGAILTVAGVVCGLGVALLVGRLLSGLLYGISASDPATLALVAAFVAIVAVTVCYLPARRAAKADPLELLRAE